MKSEECSFSLSLQFSDPSPVEYVLNFLPYFMSEFRIGLCYPAHFNYWIFGTSKLPTSDGNKVDTQMECDALWLAFDRDGSGELTADEIKLSLKEDEVLCFLVSSCFCVLKCDPSLTCRI